MDELSQLPLEEVTDMCQEERAAYRSTGNPFSPACVEIFRRAFAGDEGAWVVIDATYKPMIRRIAASILKDLDVEDTIQEAMLRFMRHAPNVEGLVATDHLGPVLAYLKSCVKTSAIPELRRRTRMSLSSLDNMLDIASDEDIQSKISGRDFVEKLQEEITSTYIERLVFQLYFVCSLPPREVYNYCKEHVDSVKDVYSIIQRLFRRMKNYRDEKGEL